MIDHEPFAGQGDRRQGGFMAASDAESGAPGPLSGLRVVDFYQGLSRRSGEKLVLFSEWRFL